MITYNFIVMDCYKRRKSIIVKANNIKFAMEILRTLTAYNEIIGLDVIWR